MRISASTNKVSSAAREIMEWLSSIVLALVFVTVLFTYVFRILGVKGTSMNPTLFENDRVVVSGLFYKPSYGDIVVITQPNEKNEPLVKRIIATEGQTVKIDASKGLVYVDGVPLDEDYVLAPTTVMGDMTGEVVVPDGKVFVLGDNRPVSWDSRYNGVGFIDEDYILGKVYMRIWPFGDIDFYF